MKRSSPAARRPGAGEGVECEQSSVSSSSKRMLLVSVPVVGMRILLLVLKLWVPAFRKICSTPKLPRRVQQRTKLQTADSNTAIALFWSEKRQSIVLLCDEEEEGGGLSCENRLVSPCAAVKSWCLGWWQVQAIDFCEVGWNSRCPRDGGTRRAPKMPG